MRSTMDYLSLGTGLTTAWHWEGTGCASARQTRTPPEERGWVLPQARAQEAHVKRHHVHARLLSLARTSYLMLTFQEQK